jgi:ribonuclease Z
VGDVQPGQVLGPARARRKVVLTGDTAPCEMTAAIAHGADLLVHEATFIEEDAERAAETSHSTALAAARLAAEAGVKMLALTHVSPRYSGGELRDEARSGFENTIVPRDFDSVEIPLPERGDPIHHREALRSAEQ